MVTNLQETTNPPLNRSDRFATSMKETAVDEVPTRKKTRNILTSP